MRRLTLSGFFALAIAAVALVVAAAMALLLSRSRHTLLAEVDKLQLAASQRLEAEVAAELGRASRAIDDVARAITTGVVSIADPAALEAPLLVRLLGDAHLEELTFTRGSLERYDEDGEAILAADGRYQITLRRTPEGTYTTRQVTPAAGPPGPTASYLAAIRHHPLAGSFPGAPLVPAGAAADPTTDLTFSVIVSQRLRGLTVWSDLHYAEADRDLPLEQRRIVLTVQRAIFTPSRVAGTPLLNDEGALLGVVRGGLLTRDLDAIAQLKVDPDSPDPQRVAIFALAPASASSAAPLRLVTRPSAADRLESVDGELRVASASLPPELAALLSSPLAARFASSAAAASSSASSASSASAASAPSRRVSGVLDVDGTRWRVSLAALPPSTGGISGWGIAVLVAEEHYTRALAATQRGVLVGFAITLAILVAIGGVALLLVRRDLARIVAATARMHGFDFAPAADRSLFGDVDAAMSGLERAKTVVRAMGKYIPMDLVRRLYAANAEPALGGELADVSILFTDIEGFTTLAEKLPVTELAQHLGAYLEVMTDAIEAQGGTIDKYIGDAVMALWNAPVPVPDHATRACAAALACLAATDALYASPRWAGLPPLTTRFGLHRSRVLVGHFGAPTRLSYTALGDGVNLAARLEPLCKQYGVRVLVSEDIAAAARASFRFRRLDRVAVKGKQRGIEIFELLGPVAASPTADAPLAADAAHASYEAAFEAYLARDFAGAAARLAPHAEADPPSAALAARCRRLAAEPPPADWDGVHVASSK